MKEEIVTAEKGVSAAKPLGEVGPQSAAGANANGGGAKISGKIDVIEALRAE